MVITIRRRQRSRVKKPTAETSFYLRNRLPIAEEISRRSIDRICVYLIVEHWLHPREREPRVTVNTVKDLIVNCIVKSELNVISGELALENTTGNCRRIWIQCSWRKDGVTGDS